jgi:hypothetical protein
MELTIEVTSRCHNRCVHCSSGSSPDCNEFIDKNIIAKAIEAINPDKVILSGGEPFLHPEIRDIIYIARKCPVLAVNTCGVFRRSHDVAVRGRLLIHESSNFFLHIRSLVIDLCFSRYLRFLAQILPVSLSGKPNQTYY